MQENDQPNYPLFESMVRASGLQLQPTYTCSAMAKLFGVTARTIQSHVADGTFPSRKLIGGARFLPADVEQYLRDAGKETPRKEKVKKKEAE
jgi:predicted DNA-binding transcriptional regulator AlpA